VVPARQRSSGCWLVALVVSSCFRRLRETREPVAGRCQGWTTRPTIPFENLKALQSGEETMRDGHKSEVLPGAPGDMATAVGPDVGQLRCAAGASVVANS